MIVLSSDQFHFLKQTLSPEVFAILDLSQINFVENGEELLDSIQLLTLIETLKTHYTEINALPVSFTSLDEPLMSLPSLLLNELVPMIDFTQFNDVFFHSESTDQAQPQLGAALHPDHLIIEQTLLETLLTNDSFNTIEPTVQAKLEIGAALHPNHLIMEQTLLETLLTDDSLNTIEPIVPAEPEISSALPLHPDHFIMEQILLETSLKQVPASSLYDKKRTGEEGFAAGQDDQQKKMKSTKDIMNSLLSAKRNKLDDAQQSHLSNSQIYSPKSIEEQQLDQRLFGNVSLQTSTSPFFTRRNTIAIISLSEDSYTRPHSPSF